MTDFRFWWRGGSQQWHPGSKSGHQVPSLGIMALVHQLGICSAASNRKPNLQKFIQQADYFTYYKKSEVEWSLTLT